MKRSVVYGNVHRIYNPDEAHDMCREVGFEIIESQLSVSLMDEAVEEWTSKDGVMVRYCYLSVLLRKPE